MIFITFDSLMKSVLFRAPKLLYCRDFCLYLLNLKKEKINGKNREKGERGKRQRLFFLFDSQNAKSITLEYEV